MSTSPLAVRTLCASLLLFSLATPAAAQVDAISLELPLFASKEKKGVETFKPLKLSKGTATVLVRFYDGEPAGNAPIHSAEVTISAKNPDAPFAAGDQPQPDKVAGNALLTFTDLPSDLLTKDIFVTTQVTTDKSAFSESPARPLGLGGITEGRDLNPRGVTLGDGGLTFPEGSANGLVLVSDANGVASWQQLSGAGVADGSIGSAQVADNSLTSADLGSASVGSDEILDRSIEFNDIAEAAVGQFELGDGAVSTNKLTDGAVISSKIADGQVFGVDVATDTLTASDIATDAIGALELADNAVGSANIIDGQIFGVDVANDTLGASDIAPDAIGASELGNNSVASANIIDGQVFGSDIANDTLTASDIAADAIGASEIAANAVGSSEIADNAVGSSEIANGSVGSVELTLGSGNSIVDKVLDTVSGGQDNAIVQLNSTRSVIAGGRDNRAGHKFNQNNYAGATVSGGRGNKAYSIATVVGGGLTNRAGPSSPSGNGGYGAVVAGGSNNTAQNTNSAILGGDGNSALALSSSVGGGERNRAEGAFSSIPGGLENVTEGRYSFAAGRQALALHDGAFVWGDASEGEKPSLEDNSFTVYAEGGSRFYSDRRALAGVALHPGSGSWSQLSDVNAKENIAPVDARAVLEKLLAMPIATWNYKTQADDVQHMGPMAQDFAAAFELGVDERLIDSVDPDGVAFAAIQGLHGVVQEKDAQIVALQAQVQSLEARFEALLAQLEAGATR